MKRINSIKFVGWKIIYGTLFRYKYFQIRKERAKLTIYNSEETVRKIIDTQCSVSRFGDGEFQLIQNYRKNCSFERNSFQHYSSELGEKLNEVLHSPSDNNHIVCIPYAFKKSSVHKGYSRIFFERETLNWVPELFAGIENNVFYDACFTRFYMGKKDIKNYPNYIHLLKSIWENQDILIIEGEQSRLGVNNDLFNNSKSIERILCPAINAFDYYDDILEACKKYGSDKLLLLALGQTATVLAYDLSRLGYWAIDIGHIDIEYEWYLRKAKNKIAIPGKYVNEVEEGRLFTQCEDEEYQRQIIEQIIYKNEPQSD